MYRKIIFTKLLNYGEEEMSNFTITNLKKYLNSMTKEELIVEIADIVNIKINALLCWNRCGIYGYIWRY